MSLVSATITNVLAAPLGACVGAIVGLGAVVAAGALVAGGALVGWGAEVGAATGAGADFDGCLWQGSEWPAA